LVNPRVPLATPEVFGAWRALGRSFSVPSDDPLDPRNWRNDLAPAAMDRAPIVGSELESLARQDGAWHVSVAGSGPTCFALMDS
ncbi:hypothetical protein R0K19_25985, partial [Bacillus sp. SIMBA_161]